MDLFNMFGAEKKKKKKSKSTSPKDGEKKTKAPKPNLADTIKSQRATIETLEKKSMLYQKKIQLATQEARAAAQAKDKRKALAALKKKKLHEGALNNLENQIMTLECQAMNLETAATNNLAVKGMAEGLKVMKENAVPVDQVDDLMEDLQEQQDNMEEMNQLFTAAADQAVGDDLEDELEALQAEMLEEDLLNVKAAPTAAMPTVAQPTAAVAQPSTAVPTNAAPAAAAPAAAQPAGDLNADEAAQLEALQAELAF